MIYFTLRIRPETPELDAAIEELGAQAFGPGRFARAAFRLREGVSHEPELSFVALMQDAKGKETLAGSIRLTRILIGGAPALVLGPLVVSPQYKNLGIGRELMNRALYAARARGEAFVILVGDEPYYGKFGFKIVPPGRITLPGPADPMRTLYCELQEGALERYGGAATRHFAPVQCKKATAA
jgi:predicted N-acetyltransferase YhbS